MRHVKSGVRLVIAGPSHDQQEVEPALVSKTTAKG
jgi:hypothetical protein